MVILLPKTGAHGSENSPEKARCRKRESRTGYETFRKIDAKKKKRTGRAIA